MAKRQKSESRKLAELVAKQRGIKVKSAQDWLRRVATGKVKRPRFDLKTDYAKRKVRKFIANYNLREVHNLRVFAKFDFYGNDKRNRVINLRLSGAELNEFLNADGSDRALQSLGRTKRNQFLQGADITNLEYFVIDGGDVETSKFFDSTAKAKRPGRAGKPGK